MSIFSSRMVHFQVRWGDAHDGYGEHYWEYNHGPSAYEEPVYAPVKAPYVPAPTVIHKLIKDHLMTLGTLNINQKLSLTTSKEKK